MLTGVTDGWIVKPLELPSDSVAEFQARLTYAADVDPASPDADDLLRETLEALGQYPDLTAALDEGARPVNIAVTMSGLEQGALALLGGINQVDAGTRNAVAAVSKLSIVELRQKLYELMRAITIVRQPLAGQDTPQAPSRRARGVVVSMLAEIFNRRTRLGPDDYLPGLFEFLDVCGQAAGIDLPAGDDELAAMIPEVLRMPRGV